MSKPVPIEERKVPSRATAASAPAGAWDYHLAPVNVDNVRAALTAAVSTTIY